MLFDFVLIRGHVVGGVFVGCEQVEIRKLFSFVTFLEVLKKDQVSLLLDVNVPRILATSDCQNGKQELDRADDAFTNGFFTIHQICCNFS